MDAQRGYPDERWFGDERNHPDNEWRDRRGGYPDDEHGRVPAQRGGYSMADVNVGYGAEPRYAQPGYPEPGYAPGPDPRPISGDPRPPVSGNPDFGPGPGGYGPRPPERGAPLIDPPTTEVPRARSEARAADRAADEGLYRSRKPLHAAAIGVSLGIFELIMLVVFFGGLFAGPIDAHRVIAGGLMMMALPLFGLGFYALVTGAAHGGPKAFLRTPLAYLPIGLFLMLAAAAAT